MVENTYIRISGCLIGLEGILLSRKNRLWKPGSVVHVVARGNRQSMIFLDRADYEIFEMLLEYLLGEFGYRLHAYCLMGNHYHLLLETNDKPLSRFMARLQTSYSMGFNSKYHMTGHTFQDRYGEFIVDNLEYFLCTSRYIHLNPIRANLAYRPEEYEWSSYSTYLGDGSKGFVTTEFTLDSFREPCLGMYSAFVESNRGESDGDSVLRALWDCARADVGFRSRLGEQVFFETKIVVENNWNK